MTIEHIIINLKRDLIRTFAVVDEWFDKSPPLQLYKPVSGGWNVREVLEHVMLTSHFLLLLIEKGQPKALRRSQEENDLATRLQGYTLAIPGLLEIGEHKSFAWHRPDHHQPSGVVPLEEIRSSLRDQLYRCLSAVESMPAGEGTLHQITMTVNNLGKLDLYQYLYFLSLHAKRHITQLQRIEEEYKAEGVRLKA